MESETRIPTISPAVWASGTSQRPTGNDGTGGCGAGTSGAGTSGAGTSGAGTSGAGSPMPWMFSCRARCSE
ncbi:hypothetical protein ACN28S_18930 [Cystobacter fuscus]